MNWVQPAVACRCHGFASASASFITLLLCLPWPFTLFLLLAFATDVLLLYGRQSASSFICSLTKAVAQEVRAAFIYRGSCVLCCGKLLLVCCIPAFHIVFVPTALPACLERSLETWLAGAAEQQARSHNGAAHAAVHSWGLLQARWGLDCQGLGLCPPCS